MRWARAIAIVGGLTACTESPAPRPSATARSGIEELAGPALATPARAPDVGPCAAGQDEAILASPKWPSSEAPLRVIAALDAPLDATLTLTGPDGAVVARSAERRGGPPSWWSLELATPAPGRYRAALAGPDGTTACRELTVLAAAPPTAGWRPPWPIERSWGRATEDLYSAWIDKLFDAPLEEQPSWSALHDVLRDPARNFLHDHLGSGEDEPGPRALIVDPDCADLPYFLRAYFAFKVGLPFGYSSCTRGGPGLPPRCVRWHSQHELTARRGGPAAAFGGFLRTSLADSVHSGNGRVPAGDDASDYYPVPLTEQSLRPGTVYADPYGHMLVVVRRIAQTADAGGVLLAVDGQPDGTIARRRFWRGNFLFAIEPALGSPGFKRFRPVVSDGRRAHGLGNDEIARAPGYGDYSVEQYSLGVDGFYDRMEEVLSPAPLDPTRALRETIQALEEQVRGRLLSVDNGEKHHATDPATIDMPEGPEIFETTGPWEDFSTPSRDLRLLIAIDIVRGFSARAARRPERYAMPAGKSVAEVRAELDSVLESELASRAFAYHRSDGTTFPLTLRDVLGRAAELELAYDPNDCVEIRWGAPPGSDEASTCRRRAPGDQRAHMLKVRPWFHERRRPARE